MKTTTKEPVKLRQKKLSNGNISLYLDIYYEGKRTYDFLKLYLIPESTLKDKERNKQTLSLANAIKSQRIVDIQTKAHGFVDAKKNGRLCFIEYMQSEVERYRSKGSVMYAQSVLNATHFLVAYAGKRVLFRHIDKTFLLGYINYLNTVKGRGGKCLAPASKATYFQTIVTALNRAVKEEIIDINPAHHIAVEDRPKVERKQREFLTLEEVKKLIDTPCNFESVKQAFLFACFCGLRLSDIQQLKWEDIRLTDKQKYTIRIIQHKTKNPVWIPLSSNAIAQLPKPRKKSGRVFTLPMVWVIEKYLDIWVHDAGIEKHVTFHVSRHTCATLLLTYGVDLYTVSKILGHTNIQTTQIYANIIDKKKQEAVDMIPCI